MDVVFTWVVACSLGSSTGVGPFIVVLSTGVGGVRCHICAGAACLC